MGPGPRVIWAYNGILLWKKKIKTKLLAKDKLIVIDRLSQRYGVLPSSFLNSTLPDLQFNILVANVGIDEENNQKEKAAKSLKSRRR